MNRYIGTWSKEHEDKQEVAELVIDGNQIEFYRRDYGEVFPCAFIGNNGENRFKIFTNGRNYFSKNKTLELSSSYRVLFALQQTEDFPEGMKIENINSFSFIIPELIDWLKISTFEYDFTEKKEVVAFEKSLPSIVLKEANPHIEIAYESDSFRSHIRADSKTTFVIKNQPRLFVNYESSVDVFRVRDDISSIMQFFGLLIGHVSTADDIRLDIEGQRFKSWLYINKDFSYNLYARNSLDQLRTNFSDMTDMVEKYFTQWYDFCCNESFAYIRRMYFLANGFKEIYAEDILVQYVRILEGYHLRISNDESISEELKNSIKEVEKNIKKMIFNDEGKTLFDEAFKKVIPDWKPNSEHFTEISHWIAGGYLGKKGLAQRIKELDDTYFNIVAKNAEHILNSSRSKKIDSTAKKEQLADQLYKNIVATRNYFSHYKADRTDVLEFSQMNYTINALKALIICILYSCMGMNLDAICEIISRDAELRFQTGFLAKKKEIDG